METRKIGFVCFASAFVGTFLTLATAMEFGLGWWLAPIGSAVFGAAAYLGYNFREVGGAFAYAWRQTVSWRPHPEWRRGVKEAAFLVLGPPASLCWAWCCLIATLIIMLAPGTMAEVSVFQKALHLFGLATIFATLVTLAFFLALVMVALGVGTLAPPEVSAEHHKLFRRWNPVSATARVLYYLPVGLYYLARGTVKLVGFLVPRLGRFAQAFFLYLHREERRICFSGTAIGVLAGFTAGIQGGTVLFGSVVGGLVGSLVGILEYRLVAIRWLRLLPAKA